MSGSMAGTMGGFGGSFGNSPINYQRQFNRAGDIFGQANAGFGGAMQGLFAGQQYSPMMTRFGGYNPATMSAQDMQSGGYDPSMIRGVDPYQAQKVQGGAYASGQLANMDLGQYMNPYEDQVVDQSLADIDRARQMASNQADAMMTSQGAFGGSRQALAQTENNRNFLDQSARTASGLRQAGYQNAQQMAMGDITNQNQASQFNLGLDMQGQLANQNAMNQASQFNNSQAMQQQMANAAARNQASQFGAQNQFAGALANMSAQNQASQFNSQGNMSSQLANQQAQMNAANYRLNSSQAMGQMANMGFGMGQQANQMMGQQGQYQRAIQQQLIDAAKQQFGGFGNAPNNSMQTLMAALSGAPIPQSQTSSSDPGVLGIMSALASMFSMSDARLKENVTHIGVTPGGHNVYDWDWNAEAVERGLSHYPTTGVMAQEVRETLPEAVIELSDGTLMVNYGRIH